MLARRRPRKPAPEASGRTFGPSRVPAIDFIGCSTVLDDPAVLALLPATYANEQLGTVSLAGRRKVNESKQRLTAMVHALCRPGRDPVVGPAAMLFEVCLARVDWDACLKAVGDAVQGLLLAGGDDRAVVEAHVVLTRPVKGKREPFVRVTSFALPSERAAFLEAIDTASSAGA